MIIDIENMNKTYRKNMATIQALKNVSFKVEKNKILGILGPNGAGKTTLLKIITGISSPGKNTGKLELLGSGDIASIRNRTGFLPENPEFPKNISAQELLKFSARISGAQVDNDTIDGLLEQVKLDKEKHTRVKQFSKGMRQRIGIAQAIIHSPELLILDEPMSGLDPPGRRMVAGIIESYYRRGKTVLFSTHNLDDIEALCTDVLVLNHGEILLEKSLSQLREKSRYTIDVEEQGEKKTFNAENDKELWNKLEEFRRQNLRIIRVQSGIARQLETYYD